MDTKNQIMNKFIENFVNSDAVRSIADEILDQDFIPRMPKEWFASLREISAEQR
jgi:hypothetical protein